MQSGRARAGGGGGVLPAGEGICEELSTGCRGGLVFYHAEWVELLELVNPDLALGTWLCLWIKHRVLFNSTGSATWAKEERAEFPSCCFSSCLWDKCNLEVGILRAAFFHSAIKISFPSLQRASHLRWVVLVYK